MLDLQKIKEWEHGKETLTIDMHNLANHLINNVPEIISLLEPKPNLPFGGQYTPITLGSYVLYEGFQWQVIELHCIENPYAVISRKVSENWSETTYVPLSSLIPVSVAPTPLPKMPSIGHLVKYDNNYYIVKSINWAIDEPTCLTLQHIPPKKGTIAPVFLESITIIPIQIGDKVKVFVYEGTYEGIVVNYHITPSNTLKYIVDLDNGKSTMENIKHLKKL